MKKIKKIYGVYDFFKSHNHPHISDKELLNAASDLIKISNDEYFKRDKLDPGYKPNYFTWEIDTAINMMPFLIMETEEKKYANDNNVNFRKEVKVINEKHDGVY